MLRAAVVGSMKPERPISFPGPHSGAEQLLNFLDGSALAVPKGELGDLRRQIAFEEHTGERFAQHERAPCA